MHIYALCVHQIRLTWQYTIYLHNKAVYIIVQHYLRKGIKLYVHNTTFRPLIFLKRGLMASACIRTAKYILFVYYPCTDYCSTRE